MKLSQIHVFICSNRIQIAVVLCTIQLKLQIAIAINFEKKLHRENRS